jgi:hypothetical protein
MTAISFVNSSYPPYPPCPLAYPDHPYKKASLSGDSGGADYCPCVSVYGFRYITLNTPIDGLRFQVKILDRQIYKLKTILQKQRVCMRWREEELRLFAYLSIKYRLLLKECNSTLASEIGRELRNSYIQTGDTRFLNPWSIDEVVNLMVETLARKALSSRELYISESSDEEISNHRRIEVFKMRMKSSITIRLSNEKRYFPEGVRELRVLMGILNEKGFYEGSLRQDLMIKREKTKEIMRDQRWTMASFFCERSQSVRVLSLVAFFFKEAKERQLMKARLSPLVTRVEPQRLVTRVEPQRLVTRVESQLFGEGRRNPSAYLNFPLTRGQSPPPLVVRRNVRVIPASLTNSIVIARPYSQGRVTAFALPRLS